MDTSRYMQVVVDKMADNMKFVGMFYIIAGGLYCLSIIGAVLGIPLIISGLRIRESAKAFQVFSLSGDTMKLEQAFSSQSSFFFINKVIMIITLIVFVAYIIFMFSIGFTLLRSLSGMDGYSV